MTVRWHRSTGGLYLPDGEPMGAPFWTSATPPGLSDAASLPSEYEGGTLWSCQLSIWQTVTLDVPTVCMDGIAVIAARCQVQVGGTASADAAVWSHVRRTGSGWGMTPGGTVPPDFKVVGQNHLSPPFEAYARLYGAAIVGPPAWSAAAEADVSVQTCEIPLTGATIDVGWGYRGTVGSARVDLFTVGFWAP